MEHKYGWGVFLVGLLLFYLLWVHQKPVPSARVAISSYPLNRTSSQAISAKPPTLSSKSNAISESASSPLSSHPPQPLPPVALVSSHSQPQTADLAMKPPETALIHRLLENLAPITKAPSEVALRPLVVEENEWRGSQCGITQSADFTFQDQTTWTYFWEKAMAPYSWRLKRTPKIDFFKNMVVGVFRGDRPFPVDEVKIASAKLEMGHDDQLALVVRYRNINGLVGVFTPRFTIQPFHLKKVPVFQGKVIFIKAP